MMFIKEIKPERPALESVSLFKNLPLKFIGIVSSYLSMQQTLSWTFLNLNYRDILRFFLFKKL